MRKIKRKKISMLDFYQEFKKLFALSLAITFISFVIVIIDWKTNNIYSNDEFLYINELPSYITESIDFNEKVYKADNGTEVFLDIRKFKDEFQISYLSKYKIDKISGNLSFASIKNESILLSSILSSSLISCFLGIIVLIMQIKKGV